MSRVRINRVAINQHIAKDPRAQAVLDTVAEAIQTQAAQLAPVKTGAYLKRFGRRRYPLRRRVYNRDPAGHLVEWGSVNNPAYAPMRRAVRALGLPLEEAPKP